LIGSKESVGNTRQPFDVRVCGVRGDISFTVSPDDRQRLSAIVAAPNSPQQHVRRARIILLSDDCLGI